MAPASRRVGEVSRWDAWRLPWPVIVRQGRRPGALQLATAATSHGPALARRPAHGGQPGQILFTATADRAPTRAPEHAPDCWPPNQRMMPGVAVHGRRGAGQWTGLPWMESHLRRQPKLKHGADQRRTRLHRRRQAVPARVGQTVAQLATPPTVTQRARGLSAAGDGPAEADSVFA